MIVHVRYMYSPFHRWSALYSTCNIQCIVTTLVHIVMTPLKWPTAKYCPSLVQQQQHALARILLLVTDFCSGDQRPTYMYNHVCACTLKWVRVIFHILLYSLHYNQTLLWWKLILIRFFANLLYLSTGWVNVNICTYTMYMSYMYH